MKFELTNELKEYMGEKGHESIYLLIKIRRGWGGTYAEVSASFGDKPPGDDMITYEVDGIKLYVQEGISAKTEIVTLGLEKLLFMERISIEGILPVFP